MRIALLQRPSVPGAFEHNLSTLRDSAIEAREAGATLLITPELFVSGYAPVAFQGWPDREAVLALPEQVAAVARETGISIAASLPRQAEADEHDVVISASLWNDTGVELLRYDKLHLWGDEPLSFVPSTTAPQLIEFQGWRVGFQICYDIEFPEPTRHLARAGGTLILVPTAIGPGAEYVTQLLVPARAAENNLVVAYANHPTVPATVPSSGSDFIGLSVVAGPEGIEYARAGSAPELLLCDLPAPEQATAAEAPYLSDVRPEVYEGWNSGDPAPHIPL